MRTENKPDFFIVGARKCGTTALYTYLAGHPEIGMSKNKEPGFFATDPEGHHRRTTTLAEYMKNFDGANEKRRIGEASGGYLGSRSAPQEILEFSPSAQIIIMVRNPIDAMHSLHSQRLLTGKEHIPRFEAALNSQETRYWRSGPFRGERVHDLDYRETVKFSSHIQPYFDRFGRERVHVIVFDDFSSAPHIEYEKVLSFLGLCSDGRHDFEIINSNQRMRSRAAQECLRLLSRKFRRWERFVPTLSRGVRRVVQQINFVREPRPPIETELLQQLQREFAPEVNRLGRLLGRNLEHWLVAPSSAPSILEVTSPSFARTHSPQT